MAARHFRYNLSLFGLMAMSPQEDACISGRASSFSAGYFFVANVKICAGLTFLLSAEVIARCQIRTGCRMPKMGQFIAN